MFNDCSSLKKINIKKIQLNNTYDMSHMFDGCTALEEIIALNRLERINRKN